MQTGLSSGRILAGPTDGDDMALMPDPGWRVPARTWVEVITRYIHFRRVKGWRGRPRGEDGHARRNRLPSKKALKLRQSLLDRVTPLVQSGNLPKSAYPLRQERSRNCSSVSRVQARNSTEHRATLNTYGEHSCSTIGAIPAVTVVARRGRHIRSLAQRFDSNWTTGERRLALGTVETISVRPISDWPVGRAT